MAGSPKNLTFGWGKGGKRFFEVLQNMAILHPENQYVIHCICDNNIYLCVEVAASDFDH